MNEQELAGEQAKSGDDAVEPRAVVEDTSATSEATAAAQIEQLERQLAEARQCAQEEKDRFIRAQAEIENMRRRNEKDLQNAHKFGLERFARELLAVVDSLELGLQAAETETNGTSALREGMELTLKQLLSVLERFEVKPIDPAGQRFNPELHQAMAMQPAAEADPNTVIKVFQKGYTLNERLLRPAMVVVSQGAPANAGIGQES
jgi:molecular chaperone GrpE